MSVIPSPTRPAEKREAGCSQHPARKDLQQETKMPAQINTMRPNGHKYSAELVLFAGMLWAPQGEPQAAVLAVLRWLVPADFEMLGARELYAAISRLVHAGKPHDMHAVLDELTRRGQLDGATGQAAKMLALNAGTMHTPPHPDALRAHAAAVVAAAHRRHVRLAGEALVELADTAPEDDLLPRMRELGTETVRRAKRLAALRGENAQETAA